jgi:hypothetical protein
LLLSGSGVCIAQDGFEDPGFHFDGSFRTRYESKQDFDNEPTADGFVWERF